MRSIGRLKVATVVAMCMALTSCATSFSPEFIRQEITRQSGQDPLSAFELDLGRFTTTLLKSVLAGEDDDQPFAGITSLQIAVYEVPNAAGPALDVTRIKVTGWDQVLRVHKPQSSGMVLIRPKGESIGDLVVVGAGPRKVIYARLRGKLNPDLPAALGKVLQDGGPDEVQRVLEQLDE